MNTYAGGPDDLGFEEPRSQSNTLGLVGFILAFCLSPIGLLLSLVALLKVPRGFAIAGVIVGLIGTAVWGFVIYGVVLVGGAAMKAMETANAVGDLQTALASAKTPEGEYPADLSGIASKNDAWGHALVYERTPDKKGYLLTSPGADGQAGTSDDFVTMQAVRGDVNIALAMMGAAGNIAGGAGGGKAGDAISASRSIFLLAITLDEAKTAGGLPETLESMAGIHPALLKDPWGSAYQYTRSADGTSYLLRSNGPDTKPDTGDEIDSQQVVGEMQKQRARARATGANP
ncbi:MAG: type II secretion system protein GspG [Planctomycetes bacterium]|nr:type II secretion system protein GspG [Planctomycetota bacterium]